MVGMMYIGRETQYLFSMRKWQRSGPTLSTSTKPASGLANGPPGFWRAGSFLPRMGFWVRAPLMTKSICEFVSGEYLICCIHGRGIAYKEAIALDYLVSRRLVEQNTFRSELIKALDSQCLQMVW